AMLCAPRRPRAHLRYLSTLMLAACTTVASPKPPASAQALPPSVTALQDAFTQVAESVSGSVVAIRIEAKRKIESPSSPFDEWFGNGRGRGGGADQYQIQRGTGSGVVLRADGYILTNKHVVENASRVEVVFRDGRKLIGKTLGIDDATDLAVVKVEA